MIRAALVVSEGRHDHRDEEGQKRPEVGEDLADVVAAATEDGEDGIAEGALQGASREAAVGLHMADLGLDGRTTPELAQQIGRKAASCATDQHARCQDAMAAIAAVDHCQRRALAGQDFHLLQRLGQGVAVVRVAGKAAHACDEALVQRGSDADLGAEFMSRTRALPLEMQSTCGSCRA